MLELLNDSVILRAYATRGIREGTDTRLLIEPNYHRSMLQKGRKQKRGRIQKLLKT